MNEKIAQLEGEIAELKARLDKRDSQQLNLPLDSVSKRVLIEAGVPNENVLKGTNTYYVAVTSGGLVTTAITFTNGVLTS